jgi:hypothetical protein
MDDLKRPIFIVGLPRSGSTLWLNIITRNSRILRAAGMHFLTPWRKDFRYFIRKEIGDLSIEKNIEKMINLIFSSEIISGITSTFFIKDLKVVNDSRLKKILYNRILESDKSLGSIFKILIEEVTRFRGNSRCCMKFPLYFNHIPELFEWFPECRILHITRDPRAMAVSRTNDPDGTRKKIEKYPLLSFIIKKIMVYFVIIQYIWSSVLHVKYKRFKNYSLFRYEDLISDPDRIIKELCEFTDIDFVPEMLVPQKGNEKGQSSSVTGEKQKGFNKEAAYRWKTRISTFDKTVITMLTNRSMKRFGYDPKNHPIIPNTIKNKI